MRNWYGSHRYKAPGRWCQEESWGRGGLGLLDSQPSWTPGTLKNPISKHKLKTQESFSVLTTDSTRTCTDMHMHAHTHAHPHISIHAHTKEICTYDKGSFASKTFPYETRGNQMNIFIWPSRPRAAVIYAVSTDTQDVSTDLKTLEGLLHLLKALHRTEVSWMWERLLTSCADRGLDALENGEMSLSVGYECSLVSLSS